ncbi:glycosyltransferase family 4 protein [Moritella sp. 24]|uniref:glycosyltransferase family 4 protein n=1 Tax=Moritella sp. 24 TaxID=2746230 RepID=UPI001BAC7B7C|nr:glycosyltransferase family 4 protein [Moritella sp. 24]QUM75916.1 glycosyltransferase family 4 protein [Moritella sp. 24]
MNLVNVIPKTAVAFYAPLKSPLHPTPSGDRKIARLFIAALEQGGFHVDLASQLRTFDKTGDSHRQQRLIALAEKEAVRVMRRWQKQGFRPQAWFCYHLYYKAPDLLGPIICKALDIPYIVAEASWAEKRANGPWAIYHRQVASALEIASKVISINPKDKVALTDFYADQPPIRYSRLISLNAFIDDLPTNINHVIGSDSMLATSAFSRDDIARKYGLNTKLPWLITIAMMRVGDKHHSYQQLSRVVDKSEQPYQLLIIGDGVMKTDVHTIFSPHKQVKFAGALDNQQIRQLLPHFDLLVWPAINEALGMIFLEAQQSNVAVVAGDEGGVGSIVKHQVTGILVDTYDPEEMSVTIDALLANPAQLKQMKQAAAHYVIQHHSIAASAIQLNDVIQDAISNKVV